MNENDLKIKIVDNIFESYNRIGFGRLLKTEIDLIMFDFSLKLFFAKKEKNEDYFIDNELNYFAIGKQDIYALSKELKITESKIITFIEQKGLLSGQLNDKQLLPFFIDLFKSQKQLNLAKGEITCYIPNKLVKNFIVAELAALGGQPDYKINNDILVFDLYYLMGIFNKKEDELFSFIQEQKSHILESDYKKLEKKIKQKDIDIKEISSDFLKIIANKVVGKSSDGLIDGLFDFLGNKWKQLP